MGMAGERNWLVSQNQVILFTWLLKFSPAEVTLWWVFHKEHKYLHINPSAIQRGPYTSSPDLLVTSFSFMFILSSWPSSQMLGHRSWIHRKSCIWPFLFAGQEFCPLGRFPVTTFFKDVPEITIVLYLSTSRCCLHIMQNHLETRLKCSLLLSSDCRELPMSP